VISAQVLSGTTLTLGWLGYLPLLAWAASQVMPANSIARSSGGTVQRSDGAGRSRPATQQNRPARRSGTLPARHRSLPSWGPVPNGAGSVGPRHVGVVARAVDR